MATYCSILAWRIPWTEELAGFSPQSCKESGTTEATSYPRTAYRYSMFQNVPESERQILALFLLCVCVKSLSRIRLFATPWTVALWAHLSMGFSRQEYWSGWPFPSPGELPNPGIQPGSPALQADSWPSEPPRKLLIPVKWQYLTRSPQSWQVPLSSPQSCLWIAQPLQFLKSELRTSLLKCPWDYDGL